MGVCWGLGDGARSYLRGFLFFFGFFFCCFLQIKGSDPEVAFACARKMVRRKLKTVSWLLSAEDNRVAQAGLLLLCNVAKLGAGNSLARELLAKFNFSLKPFQRLPYVCVWGSLGSGGGCRQMGVCVFS